MYAISRSAIVAFSTEEMYSLVNDVASYQAFLPWCGGSEVLRREPHEVLARVQIAYRGVRKSFTTRNALAPYQRIGMRLEEGPFSELSGNWEFKPLGGGCRISLDLQFDFANSLVGRVVAPVFEQIANSMVDCFAQRATQLYATPEAARFCVEVVYALAERQVVRGVEFARPVTVAEAVRGSGLLDEFPELDLANSPLGVFGVRRNPDDLLANHDRVEIYRPLQMSPTEARRRRASAV